MSRIESMGEAGYSWDNVWFADRESGLPYPFDVLVPEHRAALANEIKRIDPLVVIVDTLREASNADENSSGEMKQAISGLVAATKPAALVLVSHSRKELRDTFGGDAGNLMDDARGSSYVAGRMDSVVKLTGKKLLFKGRSIEGEPLDLVKDDLGCVHLGPSHQTRLDLATSFLDRYPKESTLAVAKLLRAHLEAAGEKKGGSLSTCRRLVEEAIATRPPSAA